MNEKFGLTKERYDELFGMREVNGKMVRKNPILFAFWKAMPERAIFSGIETMQSLKTYCMSRIDANTYDYSGHISGSPTGPRLWLNKSSFHLNGYATDDFKGICSGKDINKIRYVREGKVYRMKAGKLFRKIILENAFGSELPNEVVIWLCEEFASDWQSYVLSQCDNRYELRTDLTFADIYDNGLWHCGAFGSCMATKKREKFYDVSVKDCTPACLVDTEFNKIVCRCVIYDKVRDDETGEILRLAERQYSNNGERLQRLLIMKLIEAGKIDGYKTIGAGCSAATSFKSNDGDDWSHRKFSISVNFRKSKILSYQDSFKYYYLGDERAYNYSRDCFGCVGLDHTGRAVAIKNDTYHDKLTSNNVIDVIVNGKRKKCDVYKLEDFTRFDGTHFHNEYDMETCPECGKKMPMQKYRKGWYAESTGKYYCSRGCMLDAHGDAKKKLHFSEFDNAYTTRKKDLVNALLFSRVGGWYDCVEGYQECTILRDTLNFLFAVGQAVRYKGKIYLGTQTDENGKLTPCKVNGEIPMIPAE